MGSTAPTRHKLLLAEDNADVAKALKRLLEIEFDILEVVTSGEDLVEHAVAFRPDAIVSDVGLEGLNGIAATTRIHTLLPAVPIILVTGGDAASLRPDAVAAGAVTLLQKAGADDLVNTLRNLWPENH